MDFDNRLFCINGSSKKRFEMAIRLLIASDYDREDHKARGWYFRKDKGFILTWHYDEKKHNKFTDRLGKLKEPTTDELIELIWEWLKSDEAKTVTFTGAWERNVDHDGNNALGWKVYTEDWGHIGEENGYSSDCYAFAAIKPSYLWYGK
jgi:hypothetical protein